MRPRLICREDGEAHPPSGAPVAVRERDEPCGAWLRIAIEQPLAWPVENLVDQDETEQAVRAQGEQDARPGRGYRHFFRLDERRRGFGFSTAASTVPMPPR